MDKEEGVRIYNGILLGYEKEWNNVIYSTMDRPRECHGQHSKSDRERQIYYITYVWNAIVLRQNFFFWKPLCS